MRKYFEAVCFLGIWVCVSLLSLVIGWNLLNRANEVIAGIGLLFLIFGGYSCGVLCILAWSEIKRLWSKYVKTR